jgi:hypothetical protein
VRKATIATTRMLFRTRSKAYIPRKNNIENIMSFKSTVQPDGKSGTRKMKENEAINNNILLIDLFGLSNIFLSNIKK